MTTVEKYLDLEPKDIKKLSRRDLAHVVSTLASAANKRLVRLEKSPIGTQAPAYKTAMETGKFSVAGKNQGQLQAEYKRLKTFFSRKTSSLGGWNKVRARVRDQMIKTSGGAFENIEDEKKYWEYYRSIEKKYSHTIQKYDSGQVQRSLYREYNKSKWGASGRVAQNLKKIQEQEQIERRQQEELISKTFDNIDNQDLPRGT